MITCLFRFPSAKNPLLFFASSRSHARISRVAVAPSFTGIIMSIRIASYTRGEFSPSRASTSATASAPSPATSNATPHFTTLCLTICWFIRLSSTSKTLMPRRASNVLDESPRFSEETPTRGLRLSRFDIEEPRSAIRPRSAPRRVSASLPRAFSRRNVAIVSVSRRVAWSTSEGFAGSNTHATSSRWPSRFRSSISCLGRPNTTTPRSNDTRLFADETFSPSFSNDTRRRERDSVPDPRTRFGSGDAAASTSAADASASSDASTNTTGAPSRLACASLGSTSACVLHTT